MNVCIFRLVFHEHVSGWGKGLGEGGVAALLGDGDEVVSGAVGAAWGPRGCHTVAGTVPFRDSLEDPARGHQRIAGGHSGGRRPPRWLRRESGRVQTPAFRSSGVSSGGPVFPSPIQVHSTGV